MIAYNEYFSLKKDWDNNKTKAWCESTSERENKIKISEIIEIIEF